MGAAAVSLELSSADDAVSAVDALVGCANQSPQVAGTGAFFLDPLDNYTNRLTLLDSPNPHHRASIAGTYQLPFGKGRHFLTIANRALDAVLGGWQVVSA